MCEAALASETEKEICWIFWETLVYGLRLITFFLPCLEHNQDDHSCSYPETNEAKLSVLRKDGESLRSRR